MTLDEQFALFMRGQGWLPGSDGRYIDSLTVPARTAFNAGAAAMAEIFATHPVIVNLSRDVQSIPQQD